MKVDIDFMISSRWPIPGALNIDELNEMWKSEAARHTPHLGIDQGTEHGLCQRGPISVSSSMDQIIPQYIKAWQILERSILPSASNTALPEGQEFGRVAFENVKKRAGMRLNLTKTYRYVKCLCRW